MRTTKHEAAKTHEASQSRSPQTPRRNQTANWKHALQTLEPRVLCAATPIAAWNGVKVNPVMQPGAQFVFEKTQSLEKGNPHKAGLQPPTITPVLPPAPVIIDLPNPGDIGTIYTVAGTLWGDQGVASIFDVEQGALGFCWGDGPLQTMAWLNPTRLQEDFNVDTRGGFDGRWNGQWYHIADGFPWFENKIGPNHALWPLVAEKLVACVYGSYSAINGGWPTTAIYGFNWNVTTYALPGTDAGLAQLVTDCANNQIGLTLGTLSNAPQLIGSHCYSIIGVQIGAGGENLYTLRNPWGVDGNGNLPDENPNDGFVTISYAELVNNAYVQLCGEQ